MINARSSELLEIVDIKAQMKKARSETGGKWYKKAAGLIAHRATEAVLMYSA